VDGVWIAQGLSPGRWLAEARWGEGDHRNPTRSWVVEAGEGETTLPDIELHSTPRVHGRVTVRGDSHPCVGLTFLPLDGTGPRFGADGSYLGTYQTGGIDPGAYVVVVSRVVEEVSSFAVGSADRFAAEGWPRVTIPAGVDSLSIDIDLPAAAAD
jgi:hypothetical protein